MADEHDTNLDPDRDPPRDADPARDQQGADRFERYLEALLAGGRPSPDDVADRDEAEMARLAAELSAAADPEGAEPDGAFIDQLRLRMRQADEGMVNVRVPLPLRPAAAVAASAAGGTGSVGGRPPAPPEPSERRGRLRLTRRELLGASLSAAAGLAAGAGGYAAVRGMLVPAEPGWTETDLVAGPGEWTPVVAEADLPEGAVVSFSTPAFNGFVVNDGGQISALSASCTHLGCQLHYRPDWPDLRCPCHGASFNLRGWLANGREKWRQDGPYRGDEQAYPVELPPLARPKVHIANGQVLVWTPRI